MTMPSRQQLNVQGTIQTALENRPARPTLTVVGDGPLAGRKRDSDSYIVAVDRIRVDEDQVRQRGKGPDDEETKQLAESIREHGLLHAIDVRWMEADNIYEIVAGERRFIATTQILDWAEVPVRVLNVSDDNLPWLQLHENLHRKSLHPFDVAEPIQKAMQAGLTIDEIAAKLHKSPTLVQKAITISTKLSPEARALIERTPEIKSFDLIYEIAQLPSDEQLPLLDRIAAEDLTREEVRRLAAQAKQQLPPDQKPKGGRPTKVRPYAKTIVTKKGARVVVHFRKSRASTQEVVEALQDALKALAA